MPITFSDPQLEFIRVAATTNPDWDYLSTLLSSMPTTPVENLLGIAGRQQLDVVVAWRLLDPRLPTSLRTKTLAEAYLQNKATLGTHYIDDCNRFLTALAATDIPWVVPGGPMQYAPLGIDTFPREWDDFDVLVPTARFTEVVTLASTLGAYHPPGADERDGNVTFQWPNGTYSDLWPRGDETNGLFAERRRCDFLGVSWWIPGPAALVRQFARYTRGQVFGIGTHLPLWALARIALWITEASSTWNWTTFTDLLLRDVAPHSDLMAEYGSRDHVSLLLWVLDVADRVYGIYGGGSPLSSIPRVSEPKWQMERDTTIYTCTPLSLNMESLIVDPRLDGAEARVAAAMWSIVE